MKRINILGIPYKIEEAEAIIEADTESEDKDG